MKESYHDGPNYGVTLHGQAKPCVSMLAWFHAVTDTGFYGGLHWASMLIDAWEPAYPPEELS